MRIITIRGYGGVINGSLEGVRDVECYDIGMPIALRL
jgi:hypothetical protein